MVSDKAGVGGGPDPKNINTYLLTVNVYIIFPIKCRFWHKIYLIFYSDRLHPPSWGVQ